MYSQSYPIQRVEGSDTVVVLKMSQAAAMNNRFVRLKKEIDSVGVDYRIMKSVADSLLLENLRSSVRVRLAELKSIDAVNRVNNQWGAGVFLSVWLSTLSYFIFHN